MTTLKGIALAAAVMAAGALGCNTDKQPPPDDGTAGTIKLETWMEGIAANAEVDVTTMPENVLFTVTDKVPMSATATATATEADAPPTTTPEPGKLTVVYDEDPGKLRFLFEADPRFEAQ